MVNRFTRQSNVDIVDSTIELNAALDPQDWVQNSSGIADIAEPEDYFGASLIGGDFNADGFDDLAIGVPFENLGSVIDAGVVHVLRGTNTGITASNDQYLHQNIATAKAVRTPDTGHAPSHRVDPQTAPVACESDF